MNFNSFEEILDFAIENEKRAVSFYQKLVDKETFTASRQTFAEFAEEERKHQTLLEEFKKGKRRVRLDSIQVSIDGSCAEIHDLSRPPRSFDNALRGLRLLVENNFPVTVRVTINHHNVDDLDNIGTTEE